MSPRVAIGLPAYRRPDLIGTALASLLAQTYRDFVLVVSDDASGDGTVEVAEEFARTDSRVHVFRNEHRIGMPRNQQRAFELARSLVPEAEFFAWASDHDLWDERWLEALVAELDGNADAVLATARARCIDEHGAPSDRKRWKTVDTRGIVDPIQRLRFVLATRAAGTAMYGLFRSDVLAAGIGFRATVRSDRPLVGEIALRGHIVLVDETLWARRVGKGGLARQYVTAFPDGVPLLHRLLPSLWIHAVALLGTLVVRPRGGPTVGRLVGLCAVWAYAEHELHAPLRRRLRKLLKRIRRSLRRRSNSVLEPALGLAKRLMRHPR